MKEKNFDTISESFSMGAILALAGGFLDAYTYQSRGHVFANAQTGNMVLLAMNLSESRWQKALEYLIPIGAFALGVIVSELVKHYLGANRKIHWRQIVLLIESVLLLGVAFFPQKFNLAANVTVSFVCAMQVQGFRRVKGDVYATTMCTGNLRSAAEFFCAYRLTREPDLKRKCLNYIGIIGMFVLGALLGTLFTGFFGEKAVLMCCLPLLTGLAMLHLGVKE